jgi:hypothetical protein
MLVSALLAYRHTACFLRGGARTQGTVVALVRHLSDDVYNTNAPIANQIPHYTYSRRFDSNTARGQYSSVIAFPAGRPVIMSVTR